jgi:hypothetical protein
MSAKASSLLTNAEQFAGDFLRTFALLVDPNIPRPTHPAGQDITRWPAGQSAAFWLIGCTGVVALVTAITVGIG